MEMLDLNGQNSIRNYSAEAVNVVRIKGSQQYSCMAMLFSLQYLGLTTQGELQYRFIVNKRLFLDEKDRPVFKPSKAQKLALAVASINDDLIFEVTKNYKLIGVKNINEIRGKWKTIRSSLLLSFPDLEDLCNSFDIQLAEGNIQSLFKNDNFYNFFFA
ncbi:hypothetical protein, partial [Zobellia laminariae]|uniref:hypothetical protein n=1 Tax=Zobellia laminariae TaxID=248906 RepID=UPI003EF37952